MTSDPVDQLATALECTGLVIDSIGPNQWALPTPCTEWDVAAVVDHLAAGNARFEAALRHVELPSAMPRQPSAQESRAAYRRSVRGLLDAFRLPGALDRPVTVPFGTVPGHVAANLRITEALVHGWDLAVATGQSARFPDAIAEHALNFTQGSLGAVPPERRPFGPPRPVPDDTPVIDRLAALLGRSVSHSTESST